MDYLLLICSVFYIVAGMITILRLFAPDKSFTNYLIPVISIALAGHAFWLYQQIVMLNGQNLPILNVLSLVTFIISLLSTLANRRFNTGVLQPVIYIFTVVNLIAVTFLPSQYVTHIENHPLIATHVIIALLAYSILSIACLFSIQLAYLDYRLKNHKRPLTKINMPPLLTLEKNLIQTIIIGFSLLTATLLTGFIFIDDMFLSHKAILSTIAWIIYAFFLWGHFTKGWRGRITIYVTIATTSLLTLAYFGSRFLHEIILN